MGIRCYEVTWLCILGSWTSAAYQNRSVNLQRLIILCRVDDRSDEMSAAVSLQKREGEGII